MRAFPRPTAFLLPAVLSVVPTAAARERWVRVRTANYEVLTDASEGDGKRVARHLEQFRHLMSQILGATRRVDPERTPVLAFRNQRSLDPFAPRYQDKPVKVGGYFVRGPDRGYILLNLSSGWEEYHDVYHEQVHLIFSRNAPERALWLIEGMAEVYSTWKAVGSVLQVGRPLEGHLYLLGRQGLIPLAQFLAVGPNSPYYNEQNKQGIFYAQAWALTHYLLIDNYPEGLARLRAYLAALADKKEPLAAFRQAFGPLPQVEKALKEYVARQKFKYFPFQLASTEAEERAEVSIPSPAEVQYRLGDFLLQSGRLDEAATTLSHAVQLDGGLASARLALARAHLERHEIAEAKEEVRKALELSPRNAEAHYLRAETLLRAAGDGPVVLAWDTIAEAVNALTTALAIAPEMEKARALLESLPKAPALAAETPSSTRSAPAAAEPQSAPAPPRSETAREDAPELAEAHRQVRRGDFTRAMEALARAEQTDGSLAIRQKAQIERERLQELSAGTVQVEGTLILLRCRPDTSLTFVVQAGTRMMTLHAPTPRSVMLYGPDGEREERGFVCGPQEATVLARYVPGAPEGVPAADGTLLALYFR